MKIGNKKAKYAVTVTTQAWASKVCGVIYCDTEEEYEKLLDENFDELHDEGYFSTNISNDFDIGDVEIEEFNFEEDSQYYLNNTGEQHDKI